MSVVYSEMTMNHMRQMVADLKQSVETLAAENKELREENAVMRQENKELEEQVISAESRLETDEEVLRQDYEVELEAGAYAREQVAKLRMALKEIYDLWPYINCVCGRNAPRLGRERREAIKQLIEEGGDA